MFALTRFSAVSAVLACVLAAPAPVKRDARLSGQGTFFTPGLGACGKTSSSSDLIVAVSTDVFNGFPGAGADPNANPICGKTITANFQGKSVTVEVVDECPGCAANDLDFSPAAFDQLADESLGRIDITWSFD
ncbi:hypothetical protein BV25DRAFT_1547381 [Artomyces pyxidatus]|uniref:Uncharacterized protein n=1 Tax=Artomyces pyxidatus TaxID=48021 RepID=A0ACB8SJX4_9AGAM|nr:hypothetical protein BV25DRAFT_1547381 [Artomyces pyxidatus]